jgi:hypothetical protein
MKLRLHYLAVLSSLILFACSSRSAPHIPKGLIVLNYNYHTTDDDKDWDTGVRTAVICAGKTIASDYDHNERFGPNYWDKDTDTGWYNLPFDESIETLALIDIAQCTIRVTIAATEDDQWDFNVKMFAKYQDGRTYSMSDVGGHLCSKHGQSVSQDFAWTPSAANPSGNAGAGCDDGYVPPTGSNSTQTIRAYTKNLGQISVSGSAAIQGPATIKCEQASSDQPAAPTPAECLITVDGCGFPRQMSVGEICGASIAGTVTLSCAGSGDLTCAATIDQP